MNRSVLWKECSSGEPSPTKFTSICTASRSGWQAPLEALQDLPVDAVGIDLHVVEIGPAALGEKVGHDHRFVGIGEPRQFPGVVSELLLGRGRLQPRVADLARAHEAHAVAHLHDQRRGRPGRQIDRLVGAGAHEGRHVGDVRISLLRGEALAFAGARIDAQRLQPVAEGAPFRIEAAGAADVEQREAFRLQPLGDQCRERHRGDRTQTVATGVAGEPTAPGRRSGGAVSRKRERLRSRSHSARSFSHQISPRLRPSLNRQ